MDIQGASALSALYAPMGAVDGAFVFDDSEHMYRFFTSPASDALKQGFLDETGVRILGAWNTGARQFTANKPIRTPADLVGLKMRFPPSQQFLMNAAAMGASPVEVAYDELYLALQQGVADGQENPLVNIKAINLPEVQDYVSLSSHQLSSNLVVIGKVWDTLSPEQQAALRPRSRRPWSRSPSAWSKPRRRSSRSSAPAAPCEVDRGRRSRCIPHQGGALPQGELHARTGRGPGRDPVDGPVAGSGPVSAGPCGTGPARGSRVRRYASR